MDVNRRKFIAGGASLALADLLPGYIGIEGSRANWLFGVTPVQAGYTPFEWDGTGRTTLPVVQSAEMTFHYGTRRA